jgi:myo-inositol 2-dehydrogenase/D-chiro-inositol 1-dehydrogenase
MSAAPKVALLGAGRMGQVHGRNAARHARLELVSVVDPDAGLAAALAAELGCAVGTVEAVLADPAIDAVLVSTSTSTHLDLVLAALAAGKAVFCEKPLDLDLARLRAHAADLERPARPLYVAFNKRFDPHYGALKQKIVAGEIGALETLNLISHDPAPPPPAFIPTSGGLFRDFSIHDFDMARWLLDEEPAELFAFASCLVDPAIAAAGDVDTARILLRCASGKLCMISNTRRSGYGYDQRAEAYGSKGAAFAGNPRVAELATWTEAGALAAPIHAGFQARHAPSYAAELDHFAAVLAGETAPVTGYAASLAALALAEAATRSVATGGPVKLAEV